MGYQPETFSSIDYYFSNPIKEACNFPILIVSMKVNALRHDQPHLDKLFEDSATLIERALDYNHSMILAMVDANQDNLKMFMDELIDLENDFDNKSDLIVERLFSREVMTFSRSDRLNLIHKMENVVESVLNNARRAHSYFPTSMPPEVSNSLKIIAQNSKVIGLNLKNAIWFLFSDFSAAEQQTMRIRELRRLTRNILWSSLHDLFQKSEDPRDLVYFDRFMRDLRITYDEINDLSMTVRSLIIKYRI